MSMLSAFGLVKKSDFDRERLKSDGLRRDIIAEREKFKTAITDLAAAQDEIASLRPDAEWARARKAKAAEYEVSKRVRKAKGAG